MNAFTHTLKHASTRSNTPHTHTHTHTEELSGENRPGQCQPKKTAKYEWEGGKRVRIIWGSGPGLGPGPSHTMFRLLPFPGSALRQKVGPRKSSLASRPC